jgi:hypothetical protein
MASNKSKFESVPPDVIRLIAKQNNAVLPKLYMVPTMTVTAKKAILSEVCPEPISPDEFASYIVFIANNPSIYTKNISGTSVAIRSYRAGHISFDSTVIIRMRKDAVVVNHSSNGDFTEEIYPYPLSKANETKIYTIVKVQALRDLNRPTSLLDLGSQKWVYTRRQLCIKEDPYYVSKTIMRNIFNAIEVITPKELLGYTGKQLLRGYHGLNRITTTLFPKNVTKAKQEAYQLLLRYLLDIRVKKEGTVQRLFPSSIDPYNTDLEQQVRALLQDLFDTLRIILGEDKARHENRQP